MATVTPASVRTVDQDADWTNASNALTSNNQYATCEVGGGAFSDFLVFYGFSGIAGVALTAVNLEAFDDGADTPDSIIQVAVLPNAETADAAACGAALSSAVNLNPVPTSDGVSVIPIAATLQATDGIMVMCVTFNNTTVFSIDSLTITYTEAGGGGLAKRHRVKTLPRFRGSLAAR